MIGPRGTQRNGAKVCLWKGCGTRLNSYNTEKYCCVHVSEAARVLAVVKDDERHAENLKWRERKLKRVTQKEQAAKA